NVYLAPLKVSFALNLHERVLNNLAEMTILTGINHYIVHFAIVIVPVCLGRVRREQLPPCFAYAAATGASRQKPKRFASEPCCDGATSRYRVSHFIKSPSS